METNLKFTTFFELVAEGGYSAYIEEIPGVNTQGETMEEARENLREALQLVLDVRREELQAGRPVIPCIHAIGGSLMKRRDLVRHLEQHGCVLKREGDGHSVFINPTLQTLSAVPCNSEIKGPAALKICLDLEIPVPANVN